MPPTARPTSAATARNRASRRNRPGLPSSSRDTPACRATSRPTAAACTPLLSRRRSPALQRLRARRIGRAWSCGPTAQATSKIHRCNADPIPYLCVAQVHAIPNDVSCGCSVRTHLGDSGFSLQGDIKSLSRAEAMSSKSFRTSSPAACRARRSRSTSVISRRACLSRSFSWRSPVGSWANELPTPQAYVFAESGYPSGSGEMNAPVSASYHLFRV